CRRQRTLTSSSAFVSSRFRNSPMSIARPTAASPAATVITKKPRTCPSIDPRLRASATKVKLTAFSISSIAIKMTMTLRRMSTPTAPIAKSAALSPRYQVRGAVGGTSRPPLGQPDRPDDGDEQQDRGQLEGQQIGREQPAAERRGVAEACGQHR